jgi:hypothetical protein
MNINDVLKKDEQNSKQILHRNEEEEEEEEEEMHPQEIIVHDSEARDREYAQKMRNESAHPVEIRMREAQDREYAQKLQNEWKEEHGEIAEKFWEEKHAREVQDREMAEKMQKEEDEKGHSDKLKKETKELERDRLRVAARELEEVNRLMKAEEEIVRLRRKLAAKDSQEQWSKKKNFRLEDEVDEEEEEEGDFIANEAFPIDEEERFVPVRRRYTVAARTDASGSRKSAMASLRMPPQETDLRVDSTDEFGLLDYVSDHAPSPSGTLPHNVDAQIQNFTRMGLGPYGSGSNSGSRSGSLLGSPISYNSGVHSNPYFPTNGGSSSSSISPPTGPYGYGVGMPGPGSVVTSGSNNVVNSTISNVGNDNSVKKVYRK